MLVIRQLTQRCRFRWPAVRRARGGVAFEQLDGQLEVFDGRGERGGFEREAATTMVELGQVPALLWLEDGSPGVELHGDLEHARPRLVVLQLPTQHSTDPRVGVGALSGPERLGGRLLEAHVAKS
jgi:hypothetical protein